MKRISLNFLFAGVALILSSCGDQRSEKSDAAASRNSGSSQPQSKSRFTSRFVNLKHVDAAHGAAALSESLNKKRQDLTIVPDKRVNRIYLQGDASLVEQGNAFLGDLDKE